MIKFCPECGSKINGGKFCANCGVDLTQYGTGNSVTENTYAGSSLDDALGNLMDFANEKQAEKEKLRTLIIREMYDEARKFCNGLIDKDTMNKSGYIGLIRIASKNFKEYEGTEIEKNIRIAKEIFGEDELLSDPEYSKYITARKQYFDEKERKRQEAEAERKRIESERAEADRRRIEEHRIEAERRRIEAERAEAERGRIKAKREEAERKLDQFELSKNNDGTYKIIRIKNKLITSVIFPDNITAIGENAFQGCNMLREIKIPGSVKDIGEYAFDNCSSLTSITIPQGVISIGKRAFSFCGSLASVVIPNSVTSIGMGAFGRCGSLRYVTISNGLTYISEGMFEGCENLTSITLPDSITSVGRQAFYCCNRLSNVCIKSSYIIIRALAFSGCNSLSSVTLPYRCQYESTTFPDKCKVSRR